MDTKTRPENIADYAIELHRAGLLEEAKNAFDLVIKADPTNLVALYSLANINNSLSQFGVAAVWIDRFLERKTDFALAHIEKSKSMAGLGKIDLSKESLTQALAIDPSSTEAKQLLIAITELENNTKRSTVSQHRDASALAIAGVSAQESGDTCGAEKLFQLALHKNPDDYISLYSLGVINSARGQLDIAIELFKKASEAHPDEEGAFHGLGTVLMNKGMWEDALTSFDKALAINPSNDGVRTNQSNVLHSMRRVTDALVTLNTGLEINPNSQKLLNNKGYILTELKQYASATKTFERLTTLNPRYENALGLLAHAKLHACDWESLDELKNRILSNVSNGFPVTQPFALMSLTDEPYVIKQCAQQFGQQRFPKKNNPLWTDEKYKHRKKRLAFLSADFREHAVGYLFQAVLDHVDSAHFETIALHSGVNDGSELYRYYKAKFDHYISAESKSAKELAEILRAYEVDIAIDLSGYTSGSLLDVLSYRPAPIQITYLGYPGTLSLPYIDYLIADEITIPEREERNYSERILKLNSCYLPTSLRTINRHLVKTKIDHGLPKDSLVFCSFNHDYKINQPIFDVWMSLLHEHKDSCLWLMKLNEDAKLNLQSRAASLGINPERLIFATRVKTLDEHLARYSHVDLCLDTFPYNGHTTTFDALSMGVNVVSLAGRAFQSRVAASLLNDYGQFQNIANNLIEYKTKANQALQLKTSGILSSPNPTGTAKPESKYESLFSILNSLPSQL